MALSDGHYRMSAGCTNCRWVGRAVIPHGLTRADVCCPRCECPGTLTAMLFLWPWQWAERTCFRRRKTRDQERPGCGQAFCPSDARDWQAGRPIRASNPSWRVDGWTAETETFPRKDIS